MQQVVFESDFAVSQFDDQSRSIINSWKKHPGNEEYKDTFRKILSLVKEKSAKVFISDVRNQGTIGTDARKWMEVEILKPAIAAGLDKVAVVMDEDIFKKFYLDNVKKAGSSEAAHFQMEYFKSIEDALHWANTGEKSMALS